MFIRWKGPSVVLFVPHLKHCVRCEKLFIPQSRFWHSQSSLSRFLWYSPLSVSSVSLSVLLCLGTIVGLPSLVLYFSISRFRIPCITSNIFSHSLRSPISLVIKAAYTSFGKCLLTYLTKELNVNGGSRYFASLYSRVVYMVMLWIIHPEISSSHDLTFTLSCSSSTNICSWMSGSPPNLCYELQSISLRFP